MFTIEQLAAIATTINARKLILPEHDEYSLIAHETLEGLTWDFVELFNEKNVRFNQNWFLAAAGFAEHTSRPHSRVQL